MLRRFISDTAGATAIEYAVIAAMISVAAIGAFVALGDRSKENFQQVETAYEQAR